MDAHVYVFVCVCKRKEGKRKRFGALAFSSSPFLVAGSAGGCGQPTQSITEYYSVLFLKIPFTTRKKHFIFSIKFQVHFILYA